VTKKIIYQKKYSTIFRNSRDLSLCLTKMLGNCAMAEVVNHQVVTVEASFNPRLVHVSFLVDKVVLG
jgi:hypothetical protein